VLKLSQLSKRFGKYTAVSDFSLDVESGEFCVLLGPSGCGKTTVLRMIAGLEITDAGTISMNEVDWSVVPPQERNIAMVFQNYALYPHRTVWKNVEYPLKRRGMPKDERAKKIDAILKLLGISDLSDKRPGQLSGGEAQRVALARALVRQPTCFLMDEPLSNLDVRMRSIARVEIKNIQKELGVTTVFVTHDQEEAIALADKIAIMNEGRLVQVGTADELFSHPADVFTATFLGKPAMNLLTSTVEIKENDALHLNLEGASDASQGYLLRVRSDSKISPNSRLLVGIRPEDVHVMRDSGNSGMGWEIDGQVVLMEGIGRDHVLYCQTDAGPINVRTDAHHPIGPIKLFIPSQKTHVFDSDTEKRMDVFFENIVL
jgi:ABC-type sugar transport system ATPase subunit